MENKQTETKYQFCPEIWECSRNHNVDTIRCFGGYEMCHEYRARQEHIGPEPYGVGLGIDAMCSEDIKRIFEE